MRSMNQKIADRWGYYRLMEAALEQLAVWRMVCHSDEDSADRRGGIDGKYYYFSGENRMAEDAWSCRRRWGGKASTTLGSTAKVTSVTAVLLLTVP